MRLLGASDCVHTSFYVSLQFTLGRLRGLLLYALYFGIFVLTYLSLLALTKKWHRTLPLGGKAIGKMKGLAATLGKWM